MPQIRQGDVFITPLNEIPLDQIQYAAIPKEAQPVARTAHGHVLAGGEATGHLHAIDSPFAHLFALGNGLRFLFCDKEAALTHERHGQLTIPPGTYRVSGHHEGAPGDLPRQVQD